MRVLASRGSRYAAIAAISVATVITTAPSALAVSKLSHGQAASKFSANGVGWASSGGCSDRNNPRCTSFEQINSATVDGAITFKRASGCAVTITGGTETGHAGGTYSHWNGYKVDYRITDCVSGYITRTFTYVGQRGDGAATARRCTSPAPATSMPKRAATGM